MSEQKPDPASVDEDLELALAAFGDDLRDLLEEDDDDNAIDPAALSGVIEASSAPAPSLDPIEHMLERYGDRLNDDSNLAYAGSIALACSQAADTVPQHDTRYVVFAVGDQRFGLPLTSIVEVASDANITPLPRTEAWLKGVFILRGNMVSVTDFAKLFDIPATNSSAKKVVVLRSRQLRATTALLVDRIQGIRSIDNKKVQPLESSEP
ncbi:MAG: chemotaxis protein CheW, partial [Pirellulaceae bacterium]